MVRSSWEDLFLESDLIIQTCLTKLVPDVRLVLQRLPLVCVIVRRDFLGLTGANRVTLRSF